METKTTQYEEIKLNINGIDYYINFSVNEYWYCVDHGIGWYDYFGATGIHEDWQWELDEAEVFDVSIIEFDSEDNSVIKSIDSLDAAFAINIINACSDYAKDNAKEPNKTCGYYKYSNIDPESYWEDHDEYRYDSYYEE